MALHAPPSPGGLSQTCQWSPPREGRALLRPPARTPPATGASCGLLFCPRPPAQAPGLSRQPQDLGQLQDCLPGVKGLGKIPSGFGLDAAGEGEGLILGQ